MTRPSRGFSDIQLKGTGDDMARKNMLKDKDSKKVSLGVATSKGDIPGMKCGGKAMKGYAKGGKIDGCAKKGHTRGKMV